MMRMPQTVGELFLTGAGQLLGTIYHIKMEKDDRDDVQKKLLAIISRIALAMGSTPTHSIETEAEKMSEHLANCPCGQNGEHSTMPTQEAIETIEFGTAVMIAAVDFAVNDLEERQDLLERITTLAAHISVKAGWIPPNGESEEEVARVIRHRFGKEDDSILDCDILMYGAPDKFNG